MTATVSRSEAEHIFQKLRVGAVPERGLHAYAVGIDRARDELTRLLKLAGSGEGIVKFLRGGYGCGKTFMTRVAILEAQTQGFATSFVVVSDNDFHFHRFDVLYRKVVEALSTTACPRGALNDIIDRWIARVEDALIAGGASDSDPGFDEKVAKRLGEELESKHDRVPEDLKRALRAIFEAKQKGRLAEASALVSWLSGSTHVAAAEKRPAGIKGNIEGPQALDFLRGILEITKAAGYKGLVIAIDELETVLRMRKDIRQKSMNGIRQISDAAGQFPGLLWILTGTPDFFDTKRGVAGLEPLHDRIAFKSEQGFASPRQAQLELRAFNAERLREVALKLRELFPSESAGRIESLVTVEFIERLVLEVTKGFAGDVGVVPRQFLRRFVEVLDLTETEPGFDPMRDTSFSAGEVSPTESRLREGKKEYEPEPGDEQGYVVEPLEF